MITFKCKMCGGDLCPVEGNTTVECEFCGTMQTIATADSEKKANLFNRANRLRMASEFDKAAGVYESIVSEFPEEAEAYWGLCLCAYGIEYVDDPATGRKIPTCHRTMPESIMDNSNFEMACEYADGIARRIYRDEAKAIDRLQKDILAIVANEEPYDVFICYKETDDAGNRTVDSVLGQDIYDTLTAKGMKVFFARITLEDKLGQQYEPYIYAALHSSKVMLALGTSFDYYDAVWVKNEWSRFLDMASKDKTKTLIPCYKDIDAYDIPKEFRNLQAQDMNKLGWMQDLTRGVAKLCGKDERDVSRTETIVIQKTVPSELENLLKRGNLALEDKQWNKAKDFYDKALNLDAECAEAYLGMALAEIKCVSKEKYLACGVFDQQSANLSKAKRFADGKIKEWFVDFDSAIASKRKRMEEMRKKNSIASGRLIVGLNSVLGLKTDGTVVSTGSNEFGELDVANWKNIVSVVYLDDHTVGLLADGTVVAVGDNDYGQLNVDNWHDITHVFGTCLCTIGLKTDGTLVFVSSNEVVGFEQIAKWKDIKSIVVAEFYIAGLQKNGSMVALSSQETAVGVDARNIRNWNDIIAIAADYNNVVGLKSDGTVVAEGFNGAGECNVENWSDIAAIDIVYGFTVGLKTHGTVVATGENEYGQCNVSGWQDIVSVACGFHHTAGLRIDGSVVAVGNNEHGQCNVSKWRDIIAVACSKNNTYGLKADGTVLAVGDNTHGQCNVNNWKLFNNIDTLEQDIEENSAKMLKNIECERREQKINDLNRDLSTTQQSVADEEKKLLKLKSDLSNLKGLFTGKKRKELEDQIIITERKIKEYNMKITSLDKQLQEIQK